MCDIKCVLIYWCNNYRIDCIVGVVVYMLFLGGDWRCFFESFVLMLWGECIYVYW